MSERCAAAHKSTSFEQVGSNTSKTCVVRLCALDVVFLSSV